MVHGVHGKTPLFDRISRATVTSGEAFDITQHLGAYSVTAGGRDTTFLDATGREVFIKLDGTRTFTYSAVDKVVVGDTDPRFYGNVYTNVF